MKASEEWVLLGAAIGVGLLGWAAFKSYKAAPATPTPSPPVPPPIPITPVSGGTNITLTPGQASQNVPLDVGDPVLVRVPAGGSFTSVDGAPLRGTTPYAFVFLGPIQHTFVWNDASGAQNVTLMIFYLNPATPSTTT